MAINSNYDFSDVLPEASTGSRFRGFLADFLLLTVAYSVCHYYFGDFVFGPPAILLFVVFSLLYFSLFQYFFNYTPGLLMMRLRIVSASSENNFSLFKILFRNLVFFGSGALTAITIPFQKNNCGIHDILFKTKVVFEDPMGEPAGYWRTKFLMLVIFQIFYGGLSYYWIQRTPFLSWKIAESLKSKDVVFETFEGDWNSGFVLSGLETNGHSKVEKIRLLLDSPFNLVLSKSIIFNQIEISGIESAVRISAADLSKLIASPGVFTELVKQFEIKVVDAVVAKSIVVNSDQLNFTLKNFKIHTKRISWEKLVLSSEEVAISTGPIFVTDTKVEMKNSISFKILSTPELKLKRALDFQFHLSVLDNKIQSYYLAGLQSKIKITKQQENPFQLFIFSMNPSDFVETGFPGENLSLFTQNSEFLRLFLSSPNSGYFTFGDLKFNFDEPSNTQVSATHRRGNDDYRIIFPPTFLFSIIDSTTSATLQSNKKEHLDVQLSKIEFNESPRSLSEQKLDKLNRTLVYFGMTPRAPANQNR